MSARQFGLSVIGLSRMFDCLKVRNNLSDFVVRKRRSLDTFYFNFIYVYFKLLLVGVNCLV